MNQISKAARHEFRTTETAWSAPATTVEYDKDGNPATIVSAFHAEVRPGSVRPQATAECRAPFEIARCDAVDYDDGNPGTIRSR